MSEFVYLVKLRLENDKGEFILQDGRWRELSKRDYDLIEKTYLQRKEGDAK